MMAQKIVVRGAMHALALSMVLACGFPAVAQDKDQFSNPTVPTKIYGDKLSSEARAAAEQLVRSFCQFLDAVSMRDQDLEKANGILSTSKGLLKEAIGLYQSIVKQMSQSTPLPGPRSEQKQLYDRAIREFKDLGITVPTTYEEVFEILLREISDFSGRMSDGNFDGSWRDGAFIWDRKTDLARQGFLFRSLTILTAVGGLA